MLPNIDSILLCRLPHTWYSSYNLNLIKIFSGVVFGFVSAIIASGTDKIDRVILVGLIVMGCIPTTISSNVVMTRAAKGNDSVVSQRYETENRLH